jgi:hypothetical protein
MKAQLVKEHINFKRGLDPKRAMDIGIIKIQRIPVSIQEYKKGEYDRIENIPILGDIFYDVFDFKKIMNTLKNGIYLTNNNKNLFLDKFGRQDFVFTGEYKHYCWGFKFENGILIVLTGNKGTSYEFKGIPQKRDAKELKNLFDFIIKNNPKLEF